DQIGELGRVRVARRFARLRVARRGLPLGTEMVDPGAPEARLAAAGNAGELLERGVDRVGEALVRLFLEHRDERLKRVGVRMRHEDLDNLCVNAPVGTLRASGDELSGLVVSSLDGKPQDRTCLRWPEVFGRDIDECFERSLVLAGPGEERGGTDLRFVTSPRPGECGIQIDWMGQALG